MGLYWLKLLTRHLVAWDHVIDVKKHAVSSQRLNFQHKTTVVFNGDPVVKQMSIPPIHIVLKYSNFPECWGEGEAFLVLW